MSGTIFGLAFKWLIIGGMVMYAGFGVILVMQAKIMGEAFESDANPAVIMAAIVHLLLSVVLALAAIIIL